MTKAEIEAAAAIAEQKIACQEATHRQTVDSFASDLALYAEHASAVVELYGKCEINDFYVTADRNECNPVERKTHRSTKSLTLWSSYRQVGDGTGNRGELVGRKLVLDELGEFVQLSRTGTWSKWQGEANEWSTTEQMMSPAEVAAAYLSYCEAILKALAAAFTDAGAEEES